MLSWMKHPQDRMTCSSPQQELSSPWQRSDLVISSEPTAPDLMTIQNKRSSSESSTSDFLLEFEPVLGSADFVNPPPPRVSSSFSPESKSPHQTDTPSDEICPSLIDDIGSPSAFSIGRTISRDSSTYPPLTNYQEPVLLKASTIQHLVGARVVFDDEWTGFDDLDEPEQPEFVKRPERPRGKFSLNSLTNRSSPRKTPSLPPSSSIDSMFSQLSSDKSSGTLSAPLSPTKSTMPSPPKKTSRFKLFQRSKWPASETPQPFSPTNKNDLTRSIFINCEPVLSSVTTSSPRPPL